MEMIMHKKNTGILRLILTQWHLASVNANCNIRALEPQILRADDPWLYLYPVLWIKQGFVSGSAEYSHAGTTGLWWGACFWSRSSQYLATSGFIFHRGIASSEQRARCVHMPPVNLGLHTHNCPVYSEVYWSQAVPLFRMLSTNCIPSMAECRYWLQLRREEPQSANRFILSPGFC